MFRPRNMRRNHTIWPIKQCSQLVPSTTIHPSQWKSNMMSICYLCTLIFLCIMSLLPCLYLYLSCLVPCWCINVFMYMPLPWWLLHLYMMWMVIYNTTGRAQATETIPWQPQHDVEKDKGGKVADRHHVRLPLGWMDGRTWYQLATLLSRSYCMVSSHVSRTKHVKGDGM